jgi:5-formyltetrahydrofolate cyclo-ligase
VPAVAFDKKGRRLGRGKGYYDYFLRSLSKKTATVGLAFNFQIVPRLPTLSHDMPVERVIFA